MARSLAARRQQRLAAGLLPLLLMMTAPPTLGADGCDCLSSEMRLSAGRDALQKARLAVYGRVIDVGPAGQTKVLVLESFKGLPHEAAATVVVDALPDPGRCTPTATFAVGDETLVLSFQATTTPCDLYGRGHFLLEAFRQIAAQER